MSPRCKVLLSGLLVVGCSNEPRKATRVDVSFPDVAVPPAEDVPRPEYVAVVKASLEAVRELASRCRIEDVGDAPLGESCGIWSKADVESLGRARKALDASPWLPETGPAAYFTRSLRRFDDVVSKLWKNEAGYWAERRVGALAAYQDLALTWNAWRPSDRVVVDLVAPQAIRVPNDRAPRRSPDGHLVWTNCSASAFHEPCIQLDILPSKRP